MTILEPTHRKKPVSIAAKQWDGTRAGALAIKKWAEQDTGELILEFAGSDDTSAFFVNTLEGKMRISPLDYVIQGVEGEFYSCKPAIFEKTYDSLTLNFEPPNCETCGRPLVPGSGEGWIGTDGKFWHERCLEQGKPKAQVMLTHKGATTEWAIVHQSDGAEIYYHHGVKYSSREEALTDARAWAKSEGWDVE